MLKTMQRKATSVRMVAVVRSKDVAETVTNTLSEVNGNHVEVIEDRFEAVRARLGNSSAPDVLLVDLDPENDADVSALTSFIEERNGATAVVATSNNATIAGIRLLMRLGISDFLPQPFSRADLAGAMEIALKKIATAPGGPRRSGTGFAFMKSCGGVGATTLAVQTAYSLVNRNGSGRRWAKKGGKKTKKKVCLLDLDLQCGNVALYLDLSPKLSILDLVGPTERLDDSLLRGVMVTHPSGIEVLAAPADLIPLDAVPPEVVVRLVQVACDSYDYVVINMPETWMSWTTPVLAESNALVLVTQMKVAALRQARRRADACTQEGLSALPLVVVANRFNSPGLFSSGVRVAEAERCLGRKIDHFIRSDFKTVNEALNLGIPLAEVKSGSRVERDIERFVGAMTRRFADEDGRAEPVLTARP